MGQRGWEELLLDIVIPRQYPRLDTILQNNIQKHDKEIRLRYGAILKSEMVDHNGERRSLLILPLHNPCDNLLQRLRPPLKVL